MRREYMLEVAQSIIIEDGYINFTIDKLAEATEYAKGTIYQMFANKEEIMASICLEQAQQTYDLFKRASAFQGNHRERMAAIGIAHHIKVMQSPRTFALKLLIMNSSIREKISLELQNEMFTYESKILKLLSSIAQDAIDAGDIQTSVQPEHIVFNLWSMCFGNASICCSDIQLEKHGMANSLMIVEEGTNCLLDGYNWQPLYNPTDYHKTVLRISSEIFPNESRELGLSDFFNSLNPNKGDNDVSNA